MKYIKLIEVTLKLGICYIAQKVMVNSKQIRFYQEGSSRSKRRTSKPNMRPFPSYAQRGTLREVLFGVGLIHVNFGIGARHN